MENDNRDLLIEINERLKKIEKWEAEERKRRYIRIGVISLIVIVLAAIIVPKAISAKRAYNEALSKANEITAVFDSINLNEINEMMVKINAIEFDEISDIKGKLDEIDFNKLQKSIDSIEKIDFNSFEKTVDQIQSIDLDLLERLINTLKGLNINRTSQNQQLVLIFDFDSADFLENSGRKRLDEEFENLIRLVFKSIINKL